MTAEQEEKLERIMDRYRFPGGMGGAIGVHWLLWMRQLGKFLAYHRARGVRFDYEH